MSILDGLNEEQRLPVMATEGAVLVTAGAGSGKTRLLTHRIAYLIEEKNVLPFNILAITFTNKAANEMRERVCKMVKDGDKIWVSTFHSLCVTILRRDIECLGKYNGRFSIYSDIEKNRVLKDIYNTLKIDDEDIKKSIEYHISNIKNKNISPKDYFMTIPDYIDGELIEEVYEKYTNALQTSNALDFDDLLTKTYELFTKCPDVLGKYQNRFRYIHIDEFQDTNTVQYDIVSLLAKKWGNILVVGDEDQCIYGWRGANIENITNFRRDFPNAQIFKLEQNYRSTKKILEKANLVISNNTQRLQKTLWTENNEGKDVTYYASDTDKQEAEFVTRNIVNMVKNQEYKYSDFAILMRYNAPSRIFEEYMMRYNVPYKMLGGFKFYERAEVKNVIAYLRAIVNPLDNESITRIINVPKRGIGETTLLELKGFANGGSLLSVIKYLENYNFSPSTFKKLSVFRELYRVLAESSESMGLAEFVNFVVDKVGLKTQYNVKDDEDFNKVQNIEQFLVSVKDYEESNLEDGLTEFLESITLISDIDSVNEDNNNVLMSTVHAVKGLEFRCVFVVAMEDGIFPIIRTGDRPSDFEEERRLAYVAITRAKEQLFLTRAKSRFLYNQTKYQEISRFLVEMGYSDATEYSSSHMFSTSGYGRSEFSNNYKRDVAKNKPTESIQNLLNNRINEQKKDISSFKLGMQVLHPKFGVGKIIDDSSISMNRTVTVDFDMIGNKTLSLDYAPLQILKKQE